MRKMKFLNIQLSAYNTSLAIWLGATVSLSGSAWIGTGGTGGNGNWATAAHWSGGASPNNITVTSQNRLEFFVNETYTSTSATVALFSSARRANRIHVGLGKEVTFTLGGSLEMASDSLSIFGSSALGTGTGDSKTTFRATTANSTITMGQFYVGVGGPDVLNTLVFDGGEDSAHRLVVTDNSGLYSRVGSTGGNNELQVIRGASFQRHGLEVGAGSGWSDNRVLVRGNQSELQVVARLGVGANARDGSGDPETLYQSASRNNFVLIEEGARAQVATLAVGSAAYARSNYVEVKGAGSELVVSGGGLGIGVASSLGGNALRVSDGGTVGLYAVNPLEISSHQENSGFNDGRNRIEIGQGGTLLTDQTILNNGLIQLAAGGVLAAAHEDGSTASATLVVGSGGRFEVEGSGLQASISTQIDADGVFAVGLEGNAVGRSMDLASNLDFQDGILELSWLNAANHDYINLIAGAELSGNVVLDISFTDVVIGDQWVLFTGSTDLISAVFDLSNIDSSTWDVSGFNEAGGWTLVAVPEPGYAIGIFALVMLCVVFSRKKLCLLNGGIYH